MRWRVLQIADSAFPTGGFAHSSGLEAAVHLGEARTPVRLDSYVGMQLWSVGTSVLPFVAAAHDRPEEAWSLDALLDQMLNNHVANRASRTQGRAFISTCARVYENESIVGLARAARDRSRAAHLAPLFGASLAALDLSRAETLALYMFLALRGLASAAVRLGVVGPHEAQRLHARHARTLDAVLAECSAITPGNAAQAAPVADILSATHDTLYARLFQS